MKEDETCLKESVDDRFPVGATMQDVLLAKP